MLLLGTVQTHHICYSTKFWKIGHHNQTAVCYHDTDRSNQILVPDNECPETRVRKIHILCHKSVHIRGLIQIHNPYFRVCTCTDSTVLISRRKYYRYYLRKPLNLIISNFRFFYCIMFTPDNISNRGMSCLVLVDGNRLMPHSPVRYPPNPKTSIIHDLTFLLRLHAPPSC